MDATEDLKWERKIYERHLDLLLAEELTCRPAFARWIIDRCLDDTSIDRGTIPAGDPEHVLVEVSHDDDAGGDVSAAGENDLFVEATWGDDAKVRVLIEDKLDAVLQPRQAERYEERVGYHGNQPGVAIAVGAAIAPAGYLKVHKEALRSLAPISLEAIARQFRTDAETSVDEVSSRLLWRADRLVSLREGTRRPAPADPPTIKIRDWVIGRLAELEPNAEPHAASLRTVNTGWLYFNEPEALIYKISHGIVDIYLRDIWPDDADHQRAIYESDDVPPDFARDLDTMKNLVFRHRVSAEPRRPVASFDLGNEDDIAALKQGVDACAAAIRWIGKHASGEG